MEFEKALETARLNVEKFSLTDMQALDILSNHPSLLNVMSGPGEPTMNEFSPYLIFEDS